MVQFNFSERTIKAKVVYYGPPQSGKTTNLEQIHRISDPAGANRLISLNTAQDRTLFFDLLPFSLGTVSGYDFKIQLYTVPGQVQYNATRRVVLAGADAVVFVADGHRPMAKENVAAFENMKVNLLANRLVPEKVPLVFQYNKQDLEPRIPREEMCFRLFEAGPRILPEIDEQLGNVALRVLRRRGADVRNILDFERDYPDAHVVALEQNYRSTGTILRAANAVVARNPHRHPKRLWTALGDGDPIAVVACRDEHEEARTVADGIDAALARAENTRQAGGDSRGPGA